MIRTLKLRQNISWVIHDFEDFVIAEFCDGNHIYTVSGKDKTEAKNKLKDELDRMVVNYEV